MKPLSINTAAFALAMSLSMSSSAGALDLNGAWASAVESCPKVFERKGAQVAFTYQGTRTEWIFNRQTLLYLGSRSIDLANGATNGMSAITQRGFVDHAGQLPG